MKVLIIHTAYKYRGGEDSVVFNEMELLKANGIDADLLLFSNEGKTALKVLQMPFNISSYRAVVKKVKEFQPDVVHIHNLHYGGSPSVLHALKKMHVPVVVTLHNYRLLCPSATLYHNGEIFENSVNRQWPAKAIKNGVYQNSKPLTAILGISMYIQHLLSTWNIPKWYVVLGEHSRSVFQSSKLSHLTNRMMIKPNFCYPINNTTSTREDYYLFIGRLSKEKGINVLLEAFAENGLPLKIAGTGPLEQEVKDFCAQHTNIQLLGEQKKDEVAALICSTKALVFPSVWYETFGMVIIEAFSAGTPVIASAIGQPGNMIEDGYNGLLFEPGNAVDLNAKIASFELMTGEERATLQNNTRQTYKKKYTPERNARELISIYDSVIERKNVALKSVFVAS